MNRQPTCRIRVSLHLVIASIVSTSLIANAVSAGDPQKSAAQYLLEIMDLHAGLAADDAFLAQARLISVYLEIAERYDEPERMKVYVKVLDILGKVKRTSPEATSKLELPRDGGEGQTRSSEGKVAKQDRKTVYEPGAAILEIFKADSLDTIPPVPVIRTYWKRDLSYSGPFLIPDRVAEIGLGAPYVARFAFYYAAQEPGQYGFTIVHRSLRRDVLTGEEGNACKLKIGGVAIADVTTEPSCQGVCTLEKGIHRIEFYLTSKIPSRMGRSGRPMADFQVKILTPDSLDAMPITKEMMLLKGE